MPESGRWGGSGLLGTRFDRREEQKEGDRGGLDSARRHLHVRADTGDGEAKKALTFSGRCTRRTRAFEKGGNGPMFHVCVMMIAWLTVGYGDRGVEVRS